MAVAWKEMSAARKLGTRTRTRTPSISGIQIQATSWRVSRGERCFKRRRRLKPVERASELATAAATPSSTRSVMKISLESLAYTVLDYALEEWAGAGGDSRAYLLLTRRVLSD